LPHDRRDPAHGVIGRAQRSRVPRGGKRCVELQRYDDTTVGATNERGDDTQQARRGRDSTQYEQRDLLMIL
jgi:hypothetical protein